MLWRAYSTINALFKVHQQSTINALFNGHGQPGTSLKKLAGAATSFLTFPAAAGLGPDNVNDYDAKTTGVED